MEFEKLGCQNCGESLKKRDECYYCNHCGCTFTDVTMKKAMESLQQTIGDSLNEALLLQRDEDVAKVRRNIYQTAREEFLDVDKMLAYCHDMKKLLPDDFQANFYELACKDNVNALSSFVMQMDLTDSYYVDMVLTFLIKRLTPETLLLVNDLIGRAYENTDIEKYTKWQDKLQPEAQKLDDCVYDVTLSRDVFVAYKSEDMTTVLNLVDYLEREEGLTCFVAARNLQHGKVGDYDAKLQQAINSCKSIVFVSSKKSRRVGDARNKELPYVRQTDMANGPVEYRVKNDYKSLPRKYKKPRAEYVIEEYLNLAAEKAIAEFFDGYERCYTPHDVAASIFAQMEANDFAVNAAATTTSTAVKYCLKCGAENPANGKFCLACGCNEFGATKDVAATQTENTSDTAYVRVTLENYDVSKFQIKNKILEKCLSTDSVVVIPEGVTTIGFRAFGGCRTMTSVVIPDTVTTIETCAFTDCNNLKSVNIPNSVTIIKKNAFSACDSLTDVTLPKSIRNLENSLFMGCCALTNITIPNSVTVISNDVFWNCRSLVNMDIPTSVVAIGERAFGNCSGLKNVTIPASVTRIGSNAFSNCDNVLINCQVRNKPAGWADNWTTKLFTGKYKNVVWNSKGIVQSIKSVIDQFKN